MSSTRQTSPASPNAVASDFGNRKFKVQKKGNDKKAVEGVAVLRYGPKTVGSAHLLKAYFLNEAEPEYDPSAHDDIVDVVIGDSFKQLATTTEVNQALVELGQPGAAAGEPAPCRQAPRRRQRRGRGSAHGPPAASSSHQQVVQRPEEGRRRRQHHVRPGGAPRTARSPAARPPSRPGRPPRGPRR